MGRGAGVIPAMLVQCHQDGRLELYSLPSRQLAFTATGLNRNKRVLSDDGGRPGLDQSDEPLPGVTLSDVWRSHPLSGHPRGAI